jgi:hypothetical protein
MSYNVTRGKRLYLDLQGRMRRYILLNVDLIPAILNKHPLTSVELTLFLDIAMTYDSSQQYPCRYSYKDLSTKYQYSKNGIIKAIDGLLLIGLIERPDEDRRGRKKSQYVPNVKKIHELINSYIRKAPP